MKESKIKLRRDLKESSLEIESYSQEKKELQRTEKWREKRRGRWTGSQLKSLMSNGPGKAKLKWDNLDRLLSFGATSIKYIYENAKERQTGRYIDEGDGTTAMRYGTIVEPLIRRRVKHLLKKEGIQGKVKEVGFKTFPQLKKAGVSSDAILVLNKETKASIEMKACTNWGTHYERTYETFNDTSKDFYQVQGQMLAHEVKTCYYAVAEPPHNIKDYVYYDGDIMDMYKQFKSECKVSIIEVPISDSHCEALLQRIFIAEATVKDWNNTKNTESIKSLLNNNIKLYEKTPEKFDKSKKRIIRSKSKLSPLG